MFKLSCIVLKRNYLNTSLINQINYIKSKPVQNIPTQCRNVTYFEKNITSNIQEDESNYLVKIKNDPDLFGFSSQKKQKLDEGDLKEQEFLENQAVATKKLSTKQYADIIKDFIRKRKIKEAIDVLEVRMIKEDRVKPESYIFNLILGACGRIGYTKKAFSLYNKMKQRGLKITGGTYTALFNACSNSPWLEDGLSRARHLRDIMIEKRYEPNDTNYNAMIKAFGRCGDLSTAFSLMDEMCAKNIPIKSDSLNFLLQSCITDKEAGFRHALLVWRKYIEKNITPDIYSYNLLLKCIKECGLGDLNITKDVISRILPNNINLIENKEILLLEDKNPKRVANIDESNIQNEESRLIHLKQNILSEETQANLIGKVPHLGTILSLSKVLKAEDRLQLVGGCSGFLKNMVENRCEPNIKTVTQLLESIPSTSSAEEQLLINMKQFKIKPDIDFYNMVMKKRSLRFDYAGAKEVLDTIRKSNLRPNIMTYGVLALGCETKKEAELLIGEMKECKYRLNAEILGTMLHQACYRNRFHYVIEIMDICLKEEVQPNKKFMDCLETFKEKCETLSKDMNTLKKYTYFKAEFMKFNKHYKQWKEKIEPTEKDDLHPWQQFRQDSETDTRHYKEKDKISRFKARHTSLFRQKTGTLIQKNSNKEYKKLTNTSPVPNQIQLT